MSEWISVNHESKPPLSPMESSLSIEVLLYVPRFLKYGEDPVRVGHYLHGSGQFRPTGSHGFHNEVTHWMYKPEPPK
jgi:hypothetical protein